jgi:hypothetical protein
LKTSATKTTVSPKTGWRVLKTSPSFLNTTFVKMTSLKGNAADLAEKSHSEEVFLILGSISLLLVVIGLCIYFGHKVIWKSNRNRGQRKIKEKKNQKNKYPLRGGKDVQETIS